MGPYGPIFGFLDPVWVFFWGFWSLRLDSGGPDVLVHEVWAIFEVCGPTIPHYHAYPPMYDHISPQNYMILGFLGVLVIKIGFGSKSLSFLHVESSGGPNLDDFTMMFGFPNFTPLMYDHVFINNYMIFGLLGVLVVTVGFGRSRSPCTRSMGNI